MLLDMQRGPYLTGGFIGVILAAAVSAWLGQADRAGALEKQVRDLEERIQKLENRK